MPLGLLLDVVEMPIDSLDPRREGPTGLLDDVLLALDDVQQPVPVETNLNGVETNLNGVEIGPVPVGRRRVPTGRRRAGRSGPLDGGRARRRCRRDTTTRSSSAPTWSLIA